eukprot:3544263-Amphidinium_carterae.1
MLENPTSKLGKGKWTSNSVGCRRDKEEKGDGRACDVYSSGTSATSLCSFAEQKLSSLGGAVSSITVGIDDGKVVGVCF